MTAEFMRRVDRVSRALVMPDNVDVVDDDGMRVFRVGCFLPDAVEICMMRTDVDLMAVCRFVVPEAALATDQELSLRLHTLAMELAAQ